MPDPAPILTVRGLTYHVAGREVLNVRRLDIPATGITMILGPNGAGKSVLLRLLHGILVPAAGTVAFPGRDRPPRQAMVFQRPVLLRRSVAANVAFALSASGGSRKDLARLLNEGGLADKARQAARTLSGGEQQRLALVRALAAAPEILFLDEPTASLDPSATLAIETIIGNASATGTKIIMVTHNISQARRLAADLVFCHRGQVSEAGPAAKLLNRPETQEAKDFLEGRLRP